MFDNKIMNQRSYRLAVHHVWTIIMSQIHIMSCTSHTNNVLYFTYKYPTHTYNHTQLCSAIQSYKQRYRAINSYTQLCKAIQSYTKLYKAIHSYTEPYKAIHSYKELYNALQTIQRLELSLHNVPRN